MLASSETEIEIVGWRYLSPVYFQLHTRERRVGVQGVHGKPIPMAGRQSWNRDDGVCASR
jgi:hypothetical protein